MTWMEDEPEAALAVDDEGVLLDVLDVDDELVEVLGSALLLALLLDGEVFVLPALGELEEVWGLVLVGELELPEELELVEEPEEAWGLELLEEPVVLLSSGSVRSGMSAVGTTRAVEPGDSMGASPSGSGSRSVPGSSPRGSSSTRSNSSPPRSSIVGSALARPSSTGAAWGKGLGSGPSACRSAVGVDQSSWLMGDPMPLMKMATKSPNCRAWQKRRRPMANTSQKGRRAFAVGGVGRWPLSWA